MLLLADAPCTNVWEHGTHGHCWVHSATAVMHLPQSRGHAGLMQGVRCLACRPPVKSADCALAAVYVPITQDWYNNVTQWIADGATTNSTGAYLYQAQPFTTDPTGSTADLSAQAGAAEAPAAAGAFAPASAAGE